MRIFTAIRRWAGLLPARLISGSRFATVGAAGLVVNQALLWVLVDVAHVQNYLLAAAIATQGSTTFNFLGVESWVFRSRRHGGMFGVVKRFVAYDALNSAALLVRLPLLYLLVDGLRIQYLVANLISLVALIALRFLIADSLIWSTRILVRRTS